MINVVYLVIFLLGGSGVTSQSIPQANMIWAYETFGSHWTNDHIIVVLSKLNKGETLCHGYLNYFLYQLT